MSLIEGAFDRVLAVKLQWAHLAWFVAFLAAPITTPLVYFYLRYRKRGPNVNPPLD